MISTVRTMVYSILLVAVCWAQGSPRAQQTATKAEKPITLHLTPVETVAAPSEVATNFSDLTCDSDGTTYFGSETAGIAGIRKLNRKGELVAVYQPDANPDVKVLGAGFLP